MPAAPILLLDQTDSTNADARRRADAGETGPLWIVARRQTEGRGRRGRSWESQDGNLFSTLLQLTRKSPAEAAQVTFVAALAIADLLDSYAPASLVTIKWPNDVMLAGQKASGVLVESGVHENGGLWLAVGIGVNLAHAPDGTERPATALVHHLRGDVTAPPTVEAAAERLAGAFAVSATGAWTGGRRWGSSRSSTPGGRGRPGWRGPRWRGWVARRSRAWPRAWRPTAR